MKLRSALALLFAGALAGCQTPQMEEYQVSRDSLFALQQIDPASVSVGALEGPERFGSGTGAQLVSACSLSAEEHPGYPLGPTDYVRGALVEELRSAGLYSETAATTQITGRLTQLSLGRGLPFKGKWVMELDLASTNGAQMRVREEFGFDTGAFLGPAVCRRAVEYFEPAVRSLLEKAILSPEFPLLLR